MPCIQNIVRAILQWSKKLCILACKRDPMVRDRDIWFSVPRWDRDLPTFPRDRDETETFGNYVSRLSHDRDVETETTSLAVILQSVLNGCPASVRPHVAIVLRVVVMYLPYGFHCLQYQW